MADVAAAGKSGKVVIRNVGLMLSGDIDKPILDADTIVVNDGVITAVGREKDCDIGNPRYDEFARLFGAAGYYAEHPDQVGDAIRAALSCGKPAIVEVPIDPDEFPTPATAVRRAEARPA